MTTRPTTLPGQIPPQNAPLSYLDANGQQITDINWYLFLYRLWKEVVSSTGANALLLAQDALLMDPVSGGGGTGTGLTPIADKTILANYSGLVALPAPFALNTIAAAIIATNNWARPQNVASATLIDGATVTPNGDLSNNFYLLTTAVVGASRAMAVPIGTVPTGAIVNVEVEQPATGGPCAVAWAAGWKWGKGGQDAQPIGSVIASSVDTYSFQKQSNGNYHGVMIGQSGPTGAGYFATSVTSLTPGTGTRALTTQLGLAYSIGARARATSASTGDYFEGVVASYVSGVLTITADTFVGVTARTDWNINVSGNAGAAGPTGASGSSNFAGTSVTSNVVGLGSLVFTTQAGLAFVVGTRTRFANSVSPANFVEGVITAYSGTSITVLADLVGGTGTFTSWNLSIAGQPGTGGGSAITRVQMMGSNAADIVLTSTTLADVTGYTVSLAAVVNDRIEIFWKMDGYTSVANTSPSFGMKVNVTDITPGLTNITYTASGSPIPIVVRLNRTVIAGDIAAGIVTVQARCKVQSGNITLQNSGGYIGSLSIINWGP